MFIDVINTFLTAIPKITVKSANNDDHDDHDNPAIRKRERIFGGQ